MLMPSSGFNFDLRTVEKDLLEEEIMKANEDDDVDGRSMSRTIDV